MRLPFNTGSLTDPRMHIFNIGMLRCFEYTDPLATFRAFMSAYLDPTDFTAICPQTDTSPGALAVNGGSEWLVVLSGAYTVAQGRYLLRGWTGGNGGENTNFQPNVYVYPASQIIAGLPLFGGSRTPKLTTVGYSFGGSVAPHLATQLCPYLPGGKNVVYSYGAPRCTKRAGIPAFRAIDLFRFRNSNDPCVCLPPWTPEAPAMVALAGGYYPWGFNTYVQPNNCYSVDETGVVSVAGTGTLPALTGDLRFLDWVSGTEIFMANGHSLAEYSRRWGLVGAGSNPDQRVGEPPQVGEGGGDFGGHAVTEMNRGVEQVARQTVVNLPRAIEEARAAADVSRPSRFHRGHFRGQHAIRYEGEVVLITSTKRSARAAVKALNGMFVA